MSSNGNLKTNLNRTELETIGELVKESRNAHLRMLDKNTVKAGRDLVNTLRVLFYEARGYADGDYEGLINFIEYEAKRLEERTTLTKTQIERLEDIKDRVKSMLDDAGLSIEQEKELVVNAANADNGFENTGDEY